MHFLRVNLKSADLMWISAGPCGFLMYLLTYQTEKSHRRTKVQVKACETSRRERDPRVRPSRIRAPEGPVLHTHSYYVYKWSSCGKKAARVLIMKSPPVFLQRRCSWLMEHRVDLTFGIGIIRPVSFALLSSGVAIPHLQFLSGSVR